jgi:hypothetical protein
MNSVESRYGVLDRYICFPQNRPPISHEHHLHVASCHALAKGSKLTGDAAPGAAWPGAYSGRSVGSANGSLSGENGEMGKAAAVCGSSNIGAEWDCAGGSTGAAGVRTGESAAAGLAGAREGGSAGGALGRE